MSQTPRNCELKMTRVRKNMVRSPTVLWQKSTVHPTMTRAQLPRAWLA